MELKCSNDKLVESYAMLEVAHEVMITMMKSCQPIDKTCSHNGKKERPSWFEQVTVEDCNDDLVQEIEVLKQMVERLLKDLTRIKARAMPNLLKMILKKDQLCKTLATKHTSPTTASLK
jgi:hypothetical protein